MSDLFDTLEHLLRARPAWHAQAACRGRDPELWFPSTTVSAEVAAVCAGCPVAEECGAAGEDELFGVWAGVSATERKRRRRAA